jgi:predicted TIM-barrel fold metal-dependent hydrolase
MLSRRDALTGALAAAAALRWGGARTVALAAASQPSTPVRFTVPPGACDCHTHVFGNPQRFPYAATRTYTPESASVDEMRALHRALHMDRVVIVQPSVYGTDNACTLDAIRALGPRARGVAVIDEQTTDAALDALKQGGIRGVRINLLTSGERDPGVARRRFDAAVGRVRGARWHVQIYTELPIAVALGDRIAASPVPVVFDHFAGAQAALGTTQPGFDALLDLVRGGHVYVKISGAYRSSTRAPDFADVAPLARALIAANRARIVWGSDWPHPDSSRLPGRAVTDIAPLLQIDDGRVLNQLEAWAPDAADRAAILVANPAALYGFAA